MDVGHTNLVPRASFYSGQRQGGSGNITGYNRGLSNIGRVGAQSRSRSQI